MVRYLSAAWFDLVETIGPRAEQDPSLVLQQVVTDGPDGHVRYQVLITDTGATLRAGDSAEADMTFTSDYATAAAIAQGRESVQHAMMDGRIRVGGDPSRLADHPDRLDTADAVPEAVRAQTTYGSDA